MTRNHLDALERSHDGAIPEAALAAARAADAAEPAPPAAPPPPQQRFRSVPQLIAGRHGRRRGRALTKKTLQRGRSPGRGLLGRRDLG